MQDITVIPASEVQEHRSKIETLREQMVAIKVTSKEELTAVAEHIGTVKKAKKEVTQVRDKYIAPAKEIISHAKATFDPFINGCDEIEKVLKDKAQEYLLAEEKRAEEARAKEIKKVESGYQKPETAANKIAAIPEADRKAEASNSTLSIRKVKDVKIVDEKAIPDEWYKPRELDMVRIKKAALAGAVIPGVEVFETSQMASRSK